MNKCGEVPPPIQKWQTLSRFGFGLLCFLLWGGGGVLFFGWLLFVFVVWCIFLWVNVQICTLVYCFVHYCGVVFGVGCVTFWVTLGVYWWWLLLKYLTFQVVMVVVVMAIGIRQRLHLLYSENFIFNYMGCNCKDSKGYSYNY